MDLHSDIALENFIESARQRLRDGAATGDFGGLPFDGTIGLFARALWYAREEVPLEPAVRAGLVVDIAWLVFYRDQSRSDPAERPLLLEILAALPHRDPGDPDPAVLLSHSAASELNRALANGDVEAVEAVMRTLDSEFHAYPSRHPERINHLRLYGSAFEARFRLTGNAEDLEPAIEAIDKALELTPAGHEMIWDSKGLLGGCLLQRYSAQRDPEDLRRAFTILTEVVEGIPPNHPMRAVSLSHLGSVCLEYYHATKQPAPLADAVRHARAALDASTADDLDHSDLVGNLATLLFMQLNETGDLAGIDDAVELGRDALRLIATDHPARLGRLTAMTTLLRHQQAAQGSQRDTDDLDEAVDLWRAARPQDRPEVLLMLARSLRIRAEQTHTADGLSEAVTILRGVADRDEDGASPMLGAVCSELGRTLKYRYSRLGDPADRAEAANALGRSLDLTPTDESFRAQVLADLAGLHQAAFDRSGDLAELDEAVRLARQSCAGPVRPDTWGLRNVCATVLGDRFDHLGDIRDLDEAIEMFIEILRWTEETGRERTPALSNLSNSLLLRYQAREEPGDLNRAITTAQTIVAETSEGDPRLPGYLSTLAAAVVRRYQESRNLEDIATAIKSLEGAVRLSPADDPFHGNYLSSLSLVHLVRFRYEEDPSDLSRAIELGESAIAATPAGSPNLGRTRFNVGLAQYQRWRTTGDSAERDTAYDSWRTVAEMTETPARMRLSSASHWGHTAAQDKQWDVAADAFALAVDLLPLVAWRGLTPEAQEEAIADWPSLASDAAALALICGRFGEAVELLERGRGVIWSLLLDLRGEIDELHKEHPELAAQFESLGRELNGPGSDDRSRAAISWERTLTEIRRLPGYERFLCRPSLADLVEAGDHGPVVLLNVSLYGSAALVLRRRELLIVPLDDLTPGTADELANRWMAALARPIDDPLARAELDQVLSVLWRRVAHPVLKELGRLSTEASTRLWWCPTGPLSVLPLHAAGAAGDDCVMDHVTSSYALSLGSLLRARRRSPIQVRETSDVLLVTMPETPELPSLPGALEEAVAVARRFPVTHLTGPTATKTKVLRHLKKIRMMHIACHGHFDPTSPAASGLTLTDGLLTVREIAREDLDEARLVFLSACHTAQPGPRHLDEAITIASAFQVAGCREVVGALWAIQDSLAPQIAAKLYDLLPDHAAADSLHRVLNSLRGTDVSPAAWTQFIHLGA